MSDNQTCQECGSHYHHCTNCCHGGIPWESESFCCGNCYWDWSQREIARLQTVADAARAYIELFNDSSRPGLFEGYCKLCEAVLGDKEVGSE